MLRLSLTWLANEWSTTDETVFTIRKPFYIAIFISFLFMICILSTHTLLMSLFVSMSYITITTLLVCKTRKHIRNKYDIPETERCCCCSEDCCCAFWCRCCTVSQMARHINDYKTYAGLYCTKTGIISQAPTIV